MALTLETRLTINAPVEKVWSALTRPDLVKQYFFGTDLVTTWQVGAPIFFRGEWDGNAYEDKGTVLEFNPLKRLRYNYWSSMSDQPDEPENYANISYTVEEKGEETILTVTQDNIKDEESRAHSEQNWQSVFGQMKEMVEQESFVTK